LRLQPAQFACGETDHCGRDAGLPLPLPPKSSARVAKVPRPRSQLWLALFQVLPVIDHPTASLPVRHPSSQPARQQVSHAGDINYAYRFDYSRVLQSRAACSSPGSKAPIHAHPGQGPLKPSRGLKSISTSLRALCKTKTQICCEPRNPAARSIRRLLLL
jgi:hypothetical protein